MLGVLGGKDISDESLHAWASSAEVVYAADSGADRLIALGHSPIVVGDFDSFASLPGSSHLRLVQSIDQSTTDCDKMLRLVEEDGHGAITLTGTEGDLPDHVLATYSSIVASRLDVRIAYRRGIGYVVHSRASVATQLGQRVSLVPITTCRGVWLTGVAWPLEAAALSPGVLVSVSNEAIGARVEARVEEGRALLFLESHGVSW